MIAYVYVVNICGTLPGMAGNGYHHGALREAILKAAFDEARRVGPAGVQVRALAKAVGVSPAAVYRHFPNIEALQAEVSQTARETLAEFLIAERETVTTRRSRTATARERFRAVGRAYVEFAQREPNLFDTAFGPAVASPRPDEPSAWNVLIEGVEALIETGAIPSRDTGAAAVIAWSGVHGIASIVVRRALVGPLDGEEAIDAGLDGIMRAIETL